MQWEYGTKFDFKNSIKYSKYMEKKVLKFIEENKMLQCGDSVVLGVSGGADSLCLLILLRELAKDLDLTLTVVHVNHHIRGREADEDQKYVENICKKMEVDCRVFHIEAEKLAKEMKCSEEEAGRNARYRIFAQTLREVKGNKIAVAHNLNDCSETILFHMFRGTGIRGLTGIRPVRETIIRPLLCLTRKEIEKILEERNICFRTDSTNFSDDYTRNKLRNRVLPYIEENIHQNAARNVVKAGRDLMEIEDYLEAETKKAFAEHVEGEEQKYLVKNSVKELHPVIRKRIVRCVINNLSGRLKDVTRLHVEMVLALFEKGTGGSVNLPYEIVAERKYDGVSLCIASEKDNQVKDKVKETLIYRDGDVIWNEYVDIHLEKYGKFHENVPEIMYTKWIDCDKIKDTLVVRGRQPGDYITIDDKGNTKKLKDYFINEKIPKEKRDEILLVADGHHIVWVIGYRIGSCYKLSKDTSRVMMISYKTQS